MNDYTTRSQMLYTGLGLAILFVLGMLIGAQVNKMPEIAPTVHPWESQFVWEFDTLGYLQAYESIVPCQPRDVDLSEADSCPVCERYWEMDQKWFIHHVLPKTTFGNYYQAHKLYALGNSALEVQRALKL